MMNPPKAIKTVKPAEAGVRKQRVGPGGTDVGKKQGSGPKAAADKKLHPLPLWKRVLALPGRTKIFGGGAIALAVLIIVFLFFGSPRKEAPQKTPTQAADLSTGLGGENFLERPIGQPSPPSPLQMALPSEQEERPTIQSIRLSPPQPTRTDIKAEVVAAAYSAPGRIAYTYLWKVNNRTVEDATGDTLDLSALKKGDLVTVTVTPYEGDKAGFPVESAVIVIHGIPPSLDLQAPLKKTKVGDPLELQLVSIHPDSDAITFSLEAPFLHGMSIDSKTGKITWLFPPNQKGTLHFGAAVEDTDKTKVTKTFDIKVE